MKKTTTSNCEYDVQGIYLQPTPYNTDITAYGWKCPVCGSVMAPWQNCCVYCKPKENYTFTCGGTSDV